MRVEAYILVVDVDNPLVEVDIPLVELLNVDIRGADQAVTSAALEELP